MKNILILIIALFLVSCAAPNMDKAKQETVSTVFHVTDVYDNPGKYTVVTGYIIYNGIILYTHNQNSGAYKSCSLVVGQTFNTTITVYQEPQPNGGVLISASFVNVSQFEHIR